LHEKPAGLIGRQSDKRALKNENLSDYGQEKEEKEVASIS